MATVRVSTFLVEEFLFKGLGVEIQDVRMNHNTGVLELSVLGDDVPDCAEAHVICATYDNPGADRFTTIEIKAADTPRVNARMNGKPGAHD